jgi:hypothetical protein
MLGCRILLGNIQFLQCVIDSLVQRKGGRFATDPGIYCGGMISKVFVRMHLQHDAGQIARRVQLA